MCFTLVNNCKQLPIIIFFLYKTLKTYFAFNVLTFDSIHLAGLGVNLLIYFISPL